MARMKRTVAIAGVALALLAIGATSAPNPQRAAILESLRSVGISPNEAVMLGGVYFTIEAVDVSFNSAGDPIVTVTTKRPRR